MTEFCPPPLDAVTKRRFWESLDHRSRSLLSDRPDVLKAILDTVRVRERYRGDVEYIAGIVNGCLKDLCSHEMNDRLIAEEKKKKKKKQKLGVAESMPEQSATSSPSGTEH